MTTKETDQKRGGSGNFANDPKRASAAGKKGGEHSHGGQQSQSNSGSKAQHGVRSEDTGAPKGAKRSNASDKTS